MPFILLENVPKKMFLAHFFHYFHAIIRIIQELYSIFIYVKQLTYNWVAVIFSIEFNSKN